MVKDKPYYAMGGVFLAATVSSALISYSMTNSQEALLKTSPVVVEYAKVSSKLHATNEYIDNLKRHQMNIDDILNEKSHLLKEEETLLQDSSVKQYATSKEQQGLYVSVAVGSFAGFMLTCVGIVRRKIICSGLRGKEINTKEK